GPPKKWAGDILRNDEQVHQFAVNTVGCFNTHFICQLGRHLHRTQYLGLIEINNLEKGILAGRDGLREYLVKRYKYDMGELKPKDRYLGENRMKERLPRGIVDRMIRLGWIRV